MIKKKFIKVIKKSFHKNDDFKNKKGKGEGDEILKTILLNVTHFDSNANIIKIIIIKLFKIKCKRRKPKRNKFQKLLSFFNVYINLYFIINVIKYIIIINSNVLIRELKYKYVRKMIEYND